MGQQNASQGPNIEQGQPAFCQVCQKSTWPYIETADDGHGAIVRCATCFNQIVAPSAVAPFVAPVATALPPASQAYRPPVQFRPEPTASEPRPSGLVAMMIARRSELRSILADLAREESQLATMLAAAGIQ